LADQAHIIPFVFVRQASCSACYVSSFLAHRQARKMTYASLAPPALQGNSSPASGYYLCGGIQDLTRDHVPPANLFPEPRPSNLITVPCCRNCNQSYSLDDEAMRVWLAAAANRSASGEQIWREGVVWNRSTPSSPSRSWICLLKGGCDTCSRSAAWVKFNFSAAVTKYSRWRSFISGSTLSARLWATASSGFVETTRATERSS
jgi:hypothetical protein